MKNRTKGLIGETSVTLELLKLGYDVFNLNGIYHNYKNADIICINPENLKSTMIQVKTGTTHNIMTGILSETDGTIQRVFAESLIPNNVECIDSIVVKHFNGANDSMPSMFFMDTIEWLYPYFQSLPDPNIVYMPMVSKNDTMITDSLRMRMMIAQGGFAGYYVNGPEMLESNKEIPIAYFRRSQLRDGDRIHADLYSITPEYYLYFYSLIMSTGSNPMLGAPANVSTNIQPEGEGVGWFFTASVVSAETVFRK